MEQLAYSNAILEEVEYPVRGLIKDRNGKLIVYNTPEFDLKIIQRKLRILIAQDFVRFFQRLQRNFECCLKN